MRNSLQQLLLCAVTPELGIKGIKGDNPCASEGIHFELLQNELHSYFLTFPLQSAGVAEQWQQCVCRAIEGKGWSSWEGWAPRELKMGNKDLLDHLDICWSPGPRSGGALYTWWGKSSCPQVEGTKLVYSGITGGIMKQEEELIACACPRSQTAPPSHTEMRPQIHLPFFMEQSINGLYKVHRITKYLVLCAMYVCYVGGVWRWEDAGG